ncbi:hypothetical protein H257_07437 [Aphanomyces astaci]|nr:hypothetical protein H257_07437 [Aphanomyces astaci]ETV79424.1 hypothetical protein H257_07437 [Aphanomyces astaci]|eukprot:XP_009831265.1 hypothetical protein H257_07437 [Aphanomyces astaci]
MGWVILPALRVFEPGFILVSSGFDASYMDPLGNIMVSLQQMLWANGGCSRWCPTPAAADSCFATKGGYSDFYVPLCEALLGLRER